MNDAKAWALALLSLSAVSVAATAPCEVGGKGPKVHARIEDAVRAGCRELRLSRGRHVGGVTLPAGARLTGADGAVILGPATGAALHAPHGATLESLTIEGGEEGVTGARLSLRGVRFLRQRKSGLRAEGTLQLRNAHFEPTAGARGVVIADGAVATLEGLQLQGPAQRGIESRAAKLSLRKARFAGAVTAIHQHGGSVDLQDVEATGGSESAGIALVRTSGRLRGVRLQGFEQAVLTQHCSGLLLEEVSSRRAYKVALGFVNSEVRARDVQISDSGSFGAVQVLGGKAQLEDFWIHRASELGILARGAEVSLRRGRITGVSSSDSSEGSALFLISGSLTAAELVVRDPAGYAVMAITHARASLGDLTVHSPGAGVLAVDTGAELTARRVTVEQSRGTLLVADGDGTIDVAALRSSASAKPLAESPCRGRTRIKVHKVSALRASPSQAGHCIQLP